MKRTVRVVLILGVLWLLAGCNWSGQIDRDFGACVVLAKDGARCSVAIPAAKKEPAP
jgi:hypothetical protein